MTKQKLVIIGNGMAGARCAEEIIKHKPEAFDVMIFGSEPHVNYNRILLSSVLQGSTTLDDIIINSQEWYEKNKITLCSGETVTIIDRENNTIITDKGNKVQYDKLIIATGSNPFIIPLPGHDKEGVIAFRTIEDCEKLIQTSKKYKKAAVIGGGLLGLEAARGLLHLGMEVNVVHICDTLMERQLDFTASKMLQKELEQQGMNFLLEKATEEIVGGTRVEGLRFKDGSEVEADLVIMAVGVRPNIKLASEAGLETNRAIIVNDYMQTSDPDIYAVGECVEHRNVVYGLVKPLYEQGKELAKHICQIDSKGYQGSLLATQLKISGVDVFSVGQFQEDDTTQSLTVYDGLEGIYKKLVFREERAIGAVLFGDTRAGTKLIDLISKQEKAELVKELVINQACVEENQVASMGLGEIVCNCNSVTKGTIIEAVQMDGLSTVEEIKQCTKASGSCGSCKPLVGDLLAYIQSDDFNEHIKEEPLCSCTSMPENQVVEEIQLKQLQSIKEIRETLDWNQKDGCSVCSAALTYYLGMIYSNSDFQQEPLVDLYKNATAQSDGSYTVFPQMNGGATTAQQLRKIADVIENYGIPHVSLTKRQRMSLMGVRKEILRNVMRDLEIDLTPRHDHAVHNVRTNIGHSSSFEENKQAIELSIGLDEKVTSLNTPQDVRISVSVAGDDLADIKTKDIGFIKIERGWEIYIGGESGRTGKDGILLTVAEENEEALSIVSGLIQYYRETANYLESTRRWIERMNIVHLREVLFDIDLREELLERMELDSIKQKRKLENSFVN
ncbi:nitrite reductase large subunit NirB [Halalkalibacter urbisdiaboli]|uniref:nitrite reductase large subunit NirB n=1 Tax=Halalkalibacter urbisdiaboli TaxID=1960589 RepID=UPI000B44D5CF|nr:nitrite reductase large subunit NirB [Halalkalibacter urbisdiaboli]